MTLTNDQQLRRIGELPDHVRILAYEHPCISKAINDYAQGYIMTLPEAMCRIVVLLAVELDEYKLRERAGLQAGSIPPTVSRPHPPSSDEIRHEMVQREKGYPPTRF